MTLQQLACFCASAEQGSFSAAARSMRLSQPAVSDQVRRLEAELGTTLVQSNGRGIDLTSDGRVFVAHAERVLAGAHEAISSVGRRSAGGRRVLTLGLTRNAPYYPIDELVQRVSVEHPGLALRLPGQNSALLAEAVRARQLEAALVILPVDPQGLEVRPLFRDEVLFVSADPARARRPIDVTDLTARPLILYDAAAGFADPTRRQLATRAQEAGIALQPRFDVEDPETALLLVARGLGDTIAARAVTRSPAFPPGLSSVGFADPLFDHFALITRAGPPPPALRGLLHTLEQWAKSVR